MNYISLAEIYEQLESTSKRLEKTHIISELLKKTKAEEMEILVLLIQGRVFPLWNETTIGVSQKLVIKAISTATGTDASKIEKEWKNIGDLGRVAEKLVKHKSQATLFSKDLTMDKVYSNIKSLASIEGEGSVDYKVKIMAELLSSAKPLEARYIVRTILEDLRVGVGSGSIRDALAWAFFGEEAKINYNSEEKTIEPENREEYNKIVDEIQRAFDLKADFGIIAYLLKTKGKKAFEDLDIKPGSPINVMLYQKAKDMTDAFERVGKPCALEYKYDGFRMLIHRNGNDIKVFTRRLEDVTKQFPEAVEYVKEFIKSNDFIIDCEAVGFDPKTGKYLPFQSISQRIRRKYDIEKIAQEFPIELNIFDVIYIDGKNMLNEPYLARRKAIEHTVKEHTKKLVLSKQIITDNLEKANQFYQEALNVGEEGVMAKNLEGIYKPGNRVGFGVKVKPVMEGLDLVIVGAEWGTGKRSGWLTSFTLACRDESDFLEIGKVGTGLKELEEEGTSFEQLTNKLKDFIVEENGTSVRIKPGVIIEVNFEEIQKSPTYSSGYALRFPRFIRLREDKPLSEVSDIEQVEELYYGQTN